MTRASASTIVALAVLLGGGPALAATKEQCVDADTRAQELRRDHKLAEARAQLLVCVDASCPDIVRGDCAQRLDELSGAQPTIVFDAKDGSGGDLTAVTVTVDGRPFADKLDGSALPVEPGVRVFTFEVAGQPAVTRSLVVKEGEKQRRERVVLGKVDVPDPARASDPARTPDPALARAAATARARQTAGLVTGGVGLAGVVVGSALGALAISTWNRAKGECSATACPEHAQAVTDHDATVTYGNVSTAAFVAGGALLVTGAVLFFTGRRDAARAPALTALVPIVPWDARQRPPAGAAPGLWGLAAQGRF